MKREIKFRHWDKDTEKMYYQKDLVNTEILGLLYSTEVVKGKGDLIHMQFTGIQDINGKDIYEGDIVKSTNDIIDSEPIDIVKWENDLCGFRIDEVYYFDNCVVLGNIYENPELL